MKRKYALKYLFEVEYTDGSVYIQNPQDHSVKFPPVKDENGEYQGKSCMTDVYDDLQNGKTIRRFSLANEQNRIMVDLNNGIFYVNKLAVLLESQKLPCLPERFELIYYRQADQTVNVTYKVKNKQVQNVEDVDTLVQYFVGWQCNIYGKNYQQKIAVA